LLKLSQNDPGSNDHILRGCTAWVMLSSHLLCNNSGVSQW